MSDAPEKLEHGEPLTQEELLEAIPALKEVPATLIKQFALGAAVRRRFSPGDVVCEEGEFGSTAFLITKGAVDIFISNPLAGVKSSTGGGFFSRFFKKVKSTLGSSDESAPGGRTIVIDASVDLSTTRPVARLGQGELFGEMTCRTFQPRSATVQAAEECEMVEMLRVVLDMLLGSRDVDAATKAATKVKAPTFKGTSFKKQLDDLYRERSLVSHLRSVPLFGTLDFEFFQTLKNEAELISYGKNQIICKQNAPADAFYLIRTGLVRVAQKMPLELKDEREYFTDKTSGKEYWLNPDGSTVEDELVRTYLKRGEYFGEIGLLMDAPRNATCVALDAVDVVRIRKETFQTMLEKFPAIRLGLEQVARARTEAAKERRIPQGLQLDEFITQGLYEAQNLLLIDLDNCTRCDACVNACSDAHEGVTRLIRDGLRYDHFLVATACRSCRDPLCMTQCPVGSIRRKETLEITIEDWCIGCTKCAELCPYGNINMVEFKLTKRELADLERKEAEKEAAAKAAAEKAAAAKAAAPAAAAAKPAAPAPAAAPKPAPAPAAEKPATSAASTESVPAAADNAAKPAEKPAAPVITEAAPAAEKPAASAATPAPAAAATPAAPAPAAESKPAAAAAAPKPAPAPTAAAKPAAAPAAKPATAAKAAEPKKPAKKLTAIKATTCDLCTSLSTPSCVYACPHDAAKRVDPSVFLAKQIGRRGGGARRFNLFGTAEKNRTTH